MLFFLFRLAEDRYALDALQIAEILPLVGGTRIVLVNYPDQEGATQVLGLLAERATEIIRRDPADFVASGIGNDAALYLGPVAADARGLVQWIQVDKLLTPSVRDRLFKQPVTA